MIHDAAIVSDLAKVHESAKVWAFAQIMEGATIGADAVIGSSAHIGQDVVIGKGCRIQNAAQLFDGVVLEDDVFIGPAVIFGNIRTPRAFVSRRDAFESTLVKMGASIGAGAVVRCGVTIGRYAMVGAGAVVTGDVPDHALVVGVPAKVSGWTCRCGASISDFPGLVECTACPCQGLE